MNCNDVRKALHASQPTDDDAIARHLVDCSDCAAFAEQLDTTGPMLRRVLSAEPDDAHWSRHAAAVRSALRTNEQRRTWQRWAWVSGAAAAMLTFCAWAVYSFGAARKSDSIALQNEPVTPPKENTLTPVPTPTPTPTQNPAPESVPAGLADRVAKLQESVRSKELLDELEQLQISFDNAGDAEGKSLAEDAELYVERILSIDVAQPEQIREILAGIKTAGISARFDKLSASINDDAPAPLRDSINLAQVTLSEAGKISDAARTTGAN